jgi:Fe-S oxidoreductase
MGIHPDREMPAFARQTFTNWVMKQPELQKSSGNRQAVFFYDTYLEFNYPHIGQALVKIWQKAGLDLVVLKEKSDSGRPSFSKGDLEQARKLARKNINLLTPYVKQNSPIIGCEPSVMVMLKKEYQDLVPGPESAALSSAAMLAEEFLIQEIEKGTVKFVFDKQPRSILYHGHCQQKANFGTRKVVQLLETIPNCTVEEIEAGCCGMAGAFGYEKEHYQLSLEIAELSLAPKIRSSNQDVIICASGTSCREQIHHTTERVAFHPLEIFARALI